MSIDNIAQKTTNQCKPLIMPKTDSPLFFMSTKLSTDKVDNLDDRCEISLTTLS